MVTAKQQKKPFPDPAPIVPKGGFKQNFIKSLPIPPTAAETYTVSDGSGLSLRVSNTGKMYFVYHFRLGDLKDHLSIGRFPDISIAEANDLVSEAKKLIKDGINPKLHQKSVRTKRIESAQMTLQKLADDYLKEAAKSISPTTVQDYKDRIYRYVFPSKRPPRKDGKLHQKSIYTDWSNEPAEDITADDINDILSAITSRTAATGKPVGRSANIVLTVLKNMYSYAKKKKGFKFNPTSDISNPARPKRGKRFLEQDEIKTFWFGLLKINSKQTMTILRLQLLLARRETEVCGAQWKEFNLERGEWFIPIERKQNDVEVSSGLKVHESNKTEVPGLMVPLPKMAIDILVDWKKVTGRSTYLFPSVYGMRQLPQNYASLSRALLHHWKEMGLSEHITPHGLRRTATTHLARLQVPPFIRNRITAHTGAGDTIQQIYDRYDYFEEKLAALEKWSNEIQRLIAR